MHFLVKWKGYHTSDNSWEPRENLHADRLIAEYNKKKQEQAKPKKKGVKSRRARTEEKRPSISHNNHSHLHTCLMSARSAPIVSSVAMDATRSSTPVSPSPMMPSTPREAASSLSTSPTTPRSTALTASSRANLPSYREFGLIHCGQCQLPKEYSHTLWARGIVSGWTCRCDRTPSTPTTFPELPLAQTAQNAQELEDAGQLLARKDDSNTGDNTLGRVRPGANTNDDDEEEDATDLTEEDPLEWAYSMMRVPRIEVLVTWEVKRTVEANRQDDTQSGVSVPTKKAKESWVV